LLLKGRVWESTAAKDEAIDDWCQRVAEMTGAEWDLAPSVVEGFEGGELSGSF